jgi:hypothetical protein
MFSVAGLVWGLIPLKGFLGLVLFAAFSAGLIYVWFTAIQVSERERAPPRILGHAVPS